MILMAQRHINRGGLESLQIYVLAEPRFYNNKLEKQLTIFVNLYIV